MKTHFGTEYAGVYFTLQADGSINPGSVTTTFPGEMGRGFESVVQMDGSMVSVIHSEHVLSPMLVPLPIELDVDDYYIIDIYNELDSDDENEPYTIQPIEVE